MSLCHLGGNSTQSQYQCYIKRWHTFCNQRNEDSYYTNEDEIPEFLAAMHDKHLSCSTINTANKYRIRSITREIYTHWELRTCQAFYERTLCVEPTSPQIHGDLGCINCFRLPFFIRECKKIRFKNAHIKINNVTVFSAAQRSQTLHLLKLSNMISEGQTSYLPSRI